MDQTLPVDTEAGGGGDGADEELSELIEEMRRAATHTEAVTLERDKGRVAAHLGHKSEGLKMRLQIIRLKYARFQTIYARASMSIIIISSVAALVETVKGELRLNDRTVTDPATVHFFQLFPAIVSAIVGLVAAIVKFAKYAERTEALGRAVERTVACLSKISRTQDIVAAQQTLENLDRMSGTVSETLDEISNASTVISGVIKFRDIVKFTPEYHALTLEYLAENQHFQQRSREIVGNTEVHVLDGPTVRALDERRVGPASRPAPVTYLRRCCFRRRSVRPVRSASRELYAV